MMSGRHALPLALLILGALSVPACGGSRDSVPAEIIGKWTTTEARYADRYVEITSTQITFGTGGTGRTRNAVKGVRQTPDSRGTRFSIEYEGAVGEIESFAFILDGDSLRLANQPGFAWSRGGSDARPTAK